MKLTRQEFLLKSSLLGLMTQLKTDDVYGTEKSDFLIGACDWSLNKNADIEAFTVAKKIGLNGVQISLNSLQDELHIRDAKKRDEFKTMAIKLGQQFGGLAIGTLNSVPYKNQERTDQWVADAIEVAKDLGIKNVLLAFFGNNDLKNDPAGTRVVVNKLRQVVPLAEKAGITLGIESWLSASEHMNIIQSVGSEAVKVYYDVCNSNVMRYNIYEEIVWLGKQNMICEFHFKENGVLLGNGPVDFARVKNVMTEIGYKGWIQIEGATPQNTTPEQVYPENLKLVKKYFPA